ncbi:MAG: hypothetical protein IIZ93_00480 [Acidaminococcaceae bacterium]|nr:hypothetical protein [Acidaminococcaceae bacterium]
MAIDAVYTGADMWREYCAKYGRDEARRICNGYLDMQWATGRARVDADEMQFCRELFAAMGN